MADNKNSLTTTYCTCFVKVIFLNFRSTFLSQICTLGPGAKRNHLDVTFYVREKGRMHLGVSAHAGTQSGDAVCICILISTYITRSHC